MVVPKINLDSTADVDRIDAGGMLGILYGLPDQFLAGRKIAEQTKLAALDRKVNLIMVSGVGGSAIGGDLLRVFLGTRASLPVLVNRDYQIPRYAGKNTLMFAVSYSGNTEETLSAYGHARDRGAAVIAITSGGKLAEWAKRDGVPLIQIPGGLPPRTATGYLFISSLIALQGLGLVADTTGEVDETISLLSELRQQLAPSCPEKDNPAKQYANQAFGKIPVIYGASGTTEVVAMRWKGQVNENSKALAYFNILPELNHNEIVGTEVPPELLRQIIIFMLSNPDDHPRVKRRMELLPELLGNRVSAVVTVEARGTSQLARMFSLTYIGDYFSVYLALLYGIDPKPVHIIDTLKQRLAER